MGKGEGAKSTGYRAGTRDLFTKKFRSNGYNAPITTFMRNYKVGDVVDVVCDSRRQKGMPHKYYHGRTGRIWNVTRRAVGVEINKVHRQRQIVKRIHVRLEHLRPQVFTMKVRAAAELAMSHRQPRAAMAAIDQGLSELEELLGPDAARRSNEVHLLRGMREMLVPKLPSSQRVELEERLQAALDDENYELAAILRDELRMMKD